MGHAAWCAQASHGSPLGASRQPRGPAKAARRVPRSSTPQPTLLRGNGPFLTGFDWGRRTTFLPSALGVTRPTQELQNGSAPVRPVMCTCAGEQGRPVVGSGGWCAQSFARGMTSGTARNGIRSASEWLRSDDQITSWGMHSNESSSDPEPCDSNCMTTSTDAAMTSPGKQMQEGRPTIARLL